MPSRRSVRTTETDPALQTELALETEPALEAGAWVRTGSGPVAAGLSQRDGKTAIEGAGAAGVVHTLGVLLAFVGFGMAWAELEALGLAAPPASGAYPGAVPDRTEPTAPGDATPEIWLVDGFNVLHASLLGGRDRTEWWTEARRTEVLALVRSLTDAGGEVWVVFDGPTPAPESDGEASGVRQVFAPSADEWLLRRVRESEAPGRVAVVTGDRRLAGRARHRGALVVSPGDFLARCRRDSGAEQEQS